MTRETKIGLLVGLAFIIVIGILLSDHLTSATEPQQAQLTQAGDNVRNGVTTPGSGGAVAVTAVVAPSNVAPAQAIPTREEMNPVKPAVEIVKIGPGSPAPQPITVKASEVASAPVSNPAVAVAAPTTFEQAMGAKEPSAPPITREVDMANSSLAGVAKSLGEELVPAGAGEHPAMTQASAQPKPSLPAGARQYKAEAGDSVSRIASRMMGGNTSANRDALINANPSLKADPNKIIAGRTYVIPAAGSSAPAAPAPAPTVAAAPAPAPVASPTQTVAASPEYFYTVKEGDNLSKIALMQLGDASTLPAIKELNKDVLKGGDTIRPNMKLRLPAKPLASAR